MSAELKDFRGKVTSETDAVLEAHNRTSGRDKSEIAREVLHKWALEQIHTASLIGKLITGAGASGSAGECRGVTGEDQGTRTKRITREPHVPAYYNEREPFAAQWLRNLVAAGHIAPGVVDDRDIRDVCPADLDGFEQCHFFAGIGVWSYAARLAGWPDDRELWTGSCPCQPFSICGVGRGFDDERHLWPFWHHLIAQRRPRRILGEQVASADGLAWLDLVQDDLEGTGYAFAPVDLCAAGIGAPHLRQRLWFVADDGGEGSQGRADSHLRTTGGMKKGEALPAMVWFQLSGAMPSGSGAQTGKRARLNPAFSRWLMSLPRTWDDCAPTATPSSRKQRQP